MRRYVAFLRGVSPLNACMPDLRRCFEQAGFGNVVSVLGSGNLVFDAPSAPLPTLAQQAEAAMQRELDRSFATIVRRSDALQALLQSDPFSAFVLPADANRVVTFLRAPVATPLALPRVRDGAQLLAVAGCEAFTAYVPSATGPVFMRLIEQTLGRDVTTRTWETVRKCAAA